MTKNIMNPETKHSKISIGRQGKPIELARPVRYCQPKKTKRTSC